LLDLGANPNSTSWVVSYDPSRKGKTVLEWAIEKCDEARRNNDQQLYAAILECERSLVLAGAMHKVDPTDEFKLLMPTLNSTGR
jgi:hypothetical protein